MSGCEQPRVAAAPASLPPVRAPARVAQASSRHAVAVALSHAQPKVIVVPIIGLGLGLTAGQRFVDGEVILEEKPLLREADCEWSDAHEEAKAARLIRSFGADASASPCDGDLMVKRIKALASMASESKAKLLDVLLSADDPLPIDHSMRGTIRAVAELAASTLQIPGLWPVDEIEKGLLALSLHALKDEFVYELASRANHACAPNANFTISSDGTLRLHAIGSITPGAEITVSYLYGLSLLHWRARQRALWDNRGFACSCKLCASERLNEECMAKPIDNTEPDAEPDGEISYVSSEPDSELSSVPHASASHPSRLHLQSHLRCVRCVPLDSNGPGGNALDQSTYMRWLVDATAVPTLRRVGKTHTECRAVVGTAWRCTECKWQVDLLRENLSGEERQVFDLAQTEMQLTYQCLEQYSACTATSLLELWPTCERFLGPWHGVTLFCALKVLPVLKEDRAYKVRARLALAGVSDSLIVSRTA